LWFTRLVAPRGSNLNIAEAIHLPGAINEGCFLRALHHVGHEAETLCAHIVEVQSEPRHRIIADLKHDFLSLDFTQNKNPEAAAQDWMYRRVRAPVDLQKDQLWQNALLKLGAESYIWFHCCHHVVLDGYSGGMIAARVAAVYTAMLAGTDPAPSPFLPLRTLLEQEAAYRASDRHQIDRAHWLDYLRDIPEPASLSLRPHKAPTGECGGAITRSVTLPADRVAALTALGRSHDVTLPQTLTAFLAGYLFRVTGEADLVLGMPVSARANRALRQTPGMVANAVVLRFTFANDTTLADLMLQSRRAMRGALRHQQFRYEDLRRDLGFFDLNRQISRTGVNIEPFDYKLSFGDVTARNANLSNGAMEDLTIFVFDRQDGKGLSIQCDANPALYTYDELDAHLARIVRLVDDMLVNPELPVVSHSILSPDDLMRQKLRSTETQRHWPEVHAAELLRTALSANRDATAIIDRAGSISNGAMLAQMEALSGTLTAAGIGPGSLVAVALPRDRRMILAIAAIAASGAAWLPIDTNGPFARARMILDDAMPSLVIVPDEERSFWAAGRATLILSDNGAPENHIHLAPLETLPTATVPAGTAYVTYTSGTTGRPKGVIVPHTALGNLLLSMQEILGFDRRERILAVTTITFDIAVLELLLPLVAGGSIVVAAYEDVRDPRYLAALIRANAVTAMQATPTLWQAILSAAEGEALRGLKLLTGGEPLVAHVAQRLFRLGRDVFNLYGPTETTIWSTAHCLTADDLDNPPVGMPIANTELFIVDGQGRPLPDGVVGELMIGGSGVATGYLNRPELTHERFVTAPDGIGGQTAYRTGDRAARDENGMIWLFGRADDQVKIKGVRIELGEVETALLALEDVRQVAVLVEKEKATGAPSLAAFLVPSDGATKLDPAEIRRTLMATLPPQMIPARITVIDALPRTSSGKLDRAALLAIEPEPVAQQPSQYARTPSERMLADLWASLLNVEDVDINANFFDLGGDSLMVVQMVSALAEQGHDLPIGHVFAVPTIASLAPYFADDAVTNDPLATMLPIRQTGDKAPFFCIHPVIGLGWSFNALAALLPAEHPVYALQNAGLILGDTPPTSLEALIDLYVQEIRDIQPSGPYHLIGWSMGGVIAHGIAARLLDENEAIATLALLDSYPVRELPVGARNDAAAMVEAAMNFLHLTPDDDAPAPTSLDDVADLLLETVDMSQLPPSIGGDAGMLLALAEKFRRVTLYNFELLQNFRPGRIDIDMLFLRASFRSGSGADALIMDQADVWERFTSGTVTVQNIACRHQDMLQPDHIETVAAHLNAYVTRGVRVRAKDFARSRALPFLQEHQELSTDRHH